jgi:hypothetical protein
LLNNKILAQNLKNEDSFSYHDQILAAFQKQFPGIKFDWKKIEKPKEKDENSLYNNHILSKIKSYLAKNILKGEIQEENED